MSFDWVSCFECATCGARDYSTAVTYDALGYAICPDCGAGSDPSGPRSGDWW